MNLVSWKGGQKPLRELFAFDRHDTEGGVLRDAAAEEWHERLAGLSRECRSSSGADTEIERRRDIRYAGEVNRLVMLGTCDIDKQLFGNGIRHRVVIGDDRTIQGDWRQTASEHTSAQQYPGDGPTDHGEASQPRNGGWDFSPAVFITGMETCLGGAEQQRLESFPKARLHWVPDATGPLCWRRGLRLQ